MYHAFLAELESAIPLPNFWVQQEIEPEQWAKCWNKKIYFVKLLMYGGRCGNTYCILFDD